MDLDYYWQVVRQKICSKCIDGDGVGNCRLNEREECALQTHFPRIVQTILAIKSENMEPYILALRQNVCSGCVHESPAGLCKVRDTVDCGLDRYYPMVIAAIEEARVSEA